MIASDRIREFVEFTETNNDKDVWNMGTEEKEHQFISS